MNKFSKVKSHGGNKYAFKPVYVQTSDFRRVQSKLKNIRQSHFSAGDNITAMSRDCHVLLSEVIQRFQTIIWCFVNVTSLSFLSVSNLYVHVPFLYILCGLHICMSVCSSSFTQQVNPFILCAEGLGSIGLTPYPKYALMAWKRRFYLYLTFILDVS